MTPPRKLFVVFLAFTTVTRAADPELLQLVMPEAKVLCGLHIGRILASPFGKTVTADAERSNPELEKLIRASGFDPARDLQEILVASTGGSSNPPTLVLARGSFDSARLIAFAQGFGKKSATYQGVPMLLDIARQQSVALAFLSNSVVVAGDLESVHAAIRRRGQSSPPDSRLSAKINALSQRYDAWAASLAPLAPLTQKLPEAGVPQNVPVELLRSIQQFHGGVKFGSSVELSAEIMTRTNKDASSLADGLRFLLGLFMVNQQNARATAAAFRPENFELRAEANVVKVSLTIPEEQLRKAYQSRPHTQPPAGLVISQSAPNSAAPPGGEITIQSSTKDMGTVVISPPKQ